MEEEYLQNLFLTKVDCFELILSVFRDELYTNSYLLDLDDEEFQNVILNDKFIIHGIKIKSKKTLCDSAQTILMKLASYVTHKQDNNIHIEDILKLEKEKKIFCSSVFVLLQKQLKLERLLQHADGLRIEFENIIRIVHGYLGNSYYFIIDKDIISKIVVLSIILYKYGILPKSDDIYDDVDRMAESFVRLNSKLNGKLKFMLYQGNIQIPVSAHKIIHMEIERSIEEIGGIAFLNHFYKYYFKVLYNKKFDRFLISRDKRNFIKIGEKVKLRIPYNYLIQIAVKHLKPICKISISDDIKNKCENIIKISKWYLDILNLQSYYIYEDILFDYKNIINNISRNIIFEKMFIPRQYSIKTILLVLKYLYKPYFDGQRLKSYSFYEFYRIANYILRKHANSIITIDELSDMLHIESKIIKDIFNDISFLIKSVNNEFNYFMDPIDLYSKPLIKIDEDSNSYYMLDPRICGYGFCEVMHNIINSRVIESYQGHNIEKMVYHSLCHKGIKFKYGKYNNGKNNEDECDLVLETKDTILFIELKKCPLPNDYEELNVVNLFKSLSEGLLNAQKQILKHKLFLKMNKTMELYSTDHGKQEIVYNGRNIISVSICLPEYQFFTNKIICMKLLNSLLLLKFNVTDQNEKEKMGKFFKVQLEIQKLVGLLYGNREINIREVFHRCLFMSFQQFLTVLDICKNTNDLMEVLRFSISIFDGSMDFYSQVYNKLKMQERLKGKH